MQQPYGTSYAPGRPYTPDYAPPDPPDAVSLSSGTVVSSDGLIVTFTGETGKGSYSVTFDDGRALPARLLVDDRRSGLKLLKVDADDLPSVRLAEEEAEMGQAVVAVLCTDLKDRAVAQGIVSATDRSVPGVACEVIQTDVSVGPMSAGAPLADGEGNLLGIIAIAAGKGAGEVTETRVTEGQTVRMRQPGLTFAVPASFVQSLLEARQGDNTVVVHQGMLGIQLESSSEESESPIANRILPETPAEAAGIQEGDEIVAIDGQETSTVVGVVRGVRRRAAGDKVTVTVRRDGREIQYDVTLGRFPPAPRAAPVRAPTVEAVVPESLSLLFVDQEGQLRIVRPSYDAAQGEQMKQMMEAIRRAQQQARGQADYTLPQPQPKPPVIRVQRSDTDKKLDQLTGDVQSLREQIEKLTEEVQRLRDGLDDDPAEEP